MGMFTPTGIFSCKPEVKEIYPEYQVKEFPAKGYEECTHETFIDGDGSYHEGIIVEVDCNYHGQNNRFRCVLLTDNTFCITRIGHHGKYSEYGIAPVAAPYPIIYVPEEILGRKVTQIGHGCAAHGLYSISLIDQVENLEGIVLPNTIVQINDEAFAGKSLGCIYNKSFKINIPDSVERIGERIFIRDRYMSPRIEIEISPEQRFFTVMNDALFDKPNRRLIAYLGYVEMNQEKSYDVPQGIYHIEPYSFADTEKFHHIRIPSSVKRIGESAFEGCKIESIVIEEGVEMIEENAFRVSCSVLKSIKLPSTIKQMGTGALPISHDATYILPRDSYVAQWAISMNVKREYTDALDWLN